MLVLFILPWHQHIDTTIGNKDSLGDVYHVTWAWNSQSFTKHTSHWELSRKKLFFSMLPTILHVCISYWCLLVSENKWRQIQTGVPWDSVFSSVSSSTPPIKWANYFHKLSGPAVLTPGMYVGVSDHSYFPAFILAMGSALHGHHRSPGPVA